MLTVAKSVDLAEAAQGDVLNYQIDAINSSRAAVANVLVEDELPPYVTYVTGSTTLDGTSVSDSGSTPFPLDEGGLTIPSLPAGETAVIRFQAQVNRLDDPEPIIVGDDADGDCLLDGDASRTALVNTVIITALGFVEEDDALTCVSFAPSIDIEKATNGQDADTPTGPMIPVGGDVTWTYVVTNTGDVALSNVLVSDDQGVRLAARRRASRWASR